MAPMVVAVVNEGDAGVFNPDSLRLVQWLSDRIAEVEGIDPERVTSLATENNIRGTEEGMLVEPFWETPPATPGPGPISRVWSRAFSKELPTSGQHEESGCCRRCRRNAPKPDGIP